MDETIGATIQILNALGEIVLTENATTKKLTPEQEEEVNKLLDKIEEDDDVQNVFSTME